MTIRVGTERGLHVFDDGGRSLEVVFPGRRVDALSGDWVVLDSVEVASLTSTAHGRADDLQSRCVVHDGSAVLVGTERARLFAADDKSCDLAPIGSFDRIATRDQWHTPWGGPPDTRSMTATTERAVLVNVHVGGVWRSDDLATWHEVIEVDADTHQVHAATQTDTVVAAAAIGFGQSDDGGASWRWTDDGLHAAYCRAVAFAGDTVLVSASTGPGSRAGAIYRRPVAGNRAFERCEIKRPGAGEWFPYNLDTFQVAAWQEQVALGTADGLVFVSDDAGATWHLLTDDLPPVRCVGISNGG